MTEMTGALALEAHKLLTAITEAQKGRGDKPSTADQFLATLHKAGYDVVKLPLVASNSATAIHFPASLDTTALAAVVHKGDPKSEPRAAE
jgi:hypothetical protein